MANESFQYPAFKARWVMGTPFDLQTNDHEGKPEPDQNKHHWFVGFAVPKGPQWDALYSVMWNAALSDPSCGQALCQQPGFNWKTEDCDAPDNPQNLGKPSYPAGHMLIKFSRNIKMTQMPVIDGQYVPLDKTQVKKGDWFFIAGSTKFNGAATVKTNAGMYQNIDAMMFAEAGEVIQSEASFDAKKAFAGLQGGTAQRSGAPVGGQGFGAPQQQPAPQATAQPAPTAPVPQQPAPAAQPVYEHLDAQFTKEQYLAAGWTEDQLIQAGKGQMSQPAPAAAPGAPTAPATVQPAPDFLQQPGRVPQ